MPCKIHDKYVNAYWFKFAYESDLVIIVKTYAHTKTSGRQKILMWPTEVHSISSKTLQDPVHGIMPMSAMCLAVMDTPHFQRLRDLKQLGALYLTFPSGSHCRFEHSVGVCHLAGEMIDRFACVQPELEISSVEQEAVRLAGLCHDLGHGPFSHLFDNEFIPVVRPGVKWCHEQMSMDLLSVLVDDNAIDMEDDQIQMVKDLIAGGSATTTSRKFLYDIVANKRNGIDVDKFDYLERDAYHLGLKTTYSHKRLMGASKVVADQVCFHVREAYSVYEMFHTRYSLHKQVYSHRATKAVEYMITDALVEADACWNRRLSAAIDNPREYWKLTDHVLKDIEISTELELAKARSIIYSLRRRHLYRFVEECIVPEMVSAGLPKVSAQDLVGYNVSEIEFRAEDVIVQDVHLNYGSRAQNPVNATRFFDGASADAYAITQDRVSYMLPAHFEERILRVYTRSMNEAVLHAIAVAFCAYTKAHGFGRVF
jgi:HD superfamily phosphohydrolase